MCVGSVDKSKWSANIADMAFCFRSNGKFSSHSQSRLFKSVSRFGSAIKLVMGKL